MRSLFMIQNIEVYSKLWSCVEGMFPEKLWSNQRKTSEKEPPYAWRMRGATSNTFLNSCQRRIIFDKIKKKPVDFVVSAEYLIGVNACNYDQLL